MDKYIHFLSYEETDNEGTQKELKNFLDNRDYTYTVPPEINVLAYDFSNPLTFDKTSNLMLPIKDALNIETYTINDGQEIVGFVRVLAKDLLNYQVLALALNNKVKDRLSYLDTLIDLAENRMFLGARARERSSLLEDDGKVSPSSQLNSLTSIISFAIHKDNMEVKEVLMSRNWITVETIGDFTYYEHQLMMEKCDGR